MPQAAVDVARARAGTWFDSDLVRASESLADDRRLWDGLFGPHLSARVLDVMPAPQMVTVDDQRLDQIAEAFGAIIDGKSPFTFDHSARVASYAVAIGRRVGLDERCEPSRAHRWGWLSSGSPGFAAVADGVIPRIT